MIRLVKQMYGKITCASYYASVDNGAPNWSNNIINENQNYLCINERIIMYKLLIERSHRLMQVT